MLTPFTICLGLTAWLWLVCPCLNTRVVRSTALKILVLFFFLFFSAQSLARPTALALLTLWGRTGPVIRFPLPLAFLPLPCPAYAAYAAY